MEPPFGGCCVARAVQPFPFHASASPDWPTAIHTDAEVQDTLLRESWVTPFGLVASRVVQSLPFHDSARAAVTELATVP
jgi:hypothetical protein